MPIGYPLGRFGPMAAARSPRSAMLDRFGDPLEGDLI